MRFEPGMLLPELDDDSAPFWQACGRGELSVQRCSACGHRRFPPRPMCPSCRGFDHVWEQLSGRGTVWSYVIPHPPLLPAYEVHAPYNVVVVTIDEDPAIRMVGNLVAATGSTLDSVDPGTIRIGTPVRVVFDPVPDTTIALPRWTPRSIP